MGINMNEYLKTERKNIRSIEKNRFIKKWLKSISHCDKYSVGCNEDFLPLSINRKKHLSSAFQPTASQNLLTTCNLSSLILNEKHSVPVLNRNNRNIFKFSDLTKVVSDKEEVQSEHSNLFKINTMVNIGSEKNYQIISNLEDIYTATLSDKTDIAEDQISNASSTECNFYNINNQDFTKHVKNSSQFIESDSSEKQSNENSAVYFEEIESNTNSSDIIEEISTQIISEPSCSINDMSPNISNTAFLIPEKKKNVINSNSAIHEDISIIKQDVKNSLVSISPINFIDSVSTLKTSTTAEHIYTLSLNCTRNRKKQSSKKGTLLHLLHTLMAKERSKINLLRHQLHKKLSIASDKPFILLQIIESIPALNCTQLLKCGLIEDTMNLLQDLIKNKHQFVYVINIPDISHKINATDRVMLKVYEPWMILECAQQLMIISRFIILPNIYFKDSIGRNSNMDSVDIVSSKFKCMCPSKMTVAHRCNSNISKVLPKALNLVIDNS